MGDTEPREFDEIEQWSEESRALMLHRSDALIDAVRTYADRLAAMQGRSAEWGDQFRFSDAVRQSARAFDDAVFNHGGSTIGFLDFVDDESDLEFREDEHDDDLENLDRLVVLRRTDYVLRDPAAVLAAGRDAWRRHRERETEADAAVAVSSIDQALFAIVDMDGWEGFDSLDGLERTLHAGVALDPDVAASTPDRDEHFGVLDEGGLDAAELMRVDGDVLTSSIRWY